MKQLFIFILLLLLSCSKPESVTPPVDLVAYSEQEGVLIVTPNRYDLQPEFWGSRGKVVNAVWRNGVLVSGTVYKQNFQGEWENIGLQAVVHFSPDPGYVIGAGRD